MEAANQTEADRRADPASGVEGEKHGGEVGRMGLENVLAVEDGETFGVGALGGEEDVGREAHRCRLGRCQYVGIPGDDGRLVREEQAEDLVSDFAGELEEGEGYRRAGSR